MGIGCRIVTGRHIFCIPPSEHPYYPVSYLDFSLAQIKYSNKTWDYHVLTNAFCRRNVIQDERRVQDGWQFLDASPFERRKGFNPFGPFPLKSLKNDNISEIPFEGEIVEYMLRRYDIIWACSHNNKLMKTIMVYNDRKMLTQGLDSYKIDDVSNEHECKIPDYFRILNKWVEFDASGVRNIYLWKTNNIEISCRTYQSTNEKIFVAMISENSFPSRNLENIISRKIISRQFTVDHKIQFSINPYHTKLHNIRIIDLSYYFFDPSTGFVKFDKYTMELKWYRIKFYTNIPITELNKDRKIKMEFKNFFHEPYHLLGKIGPSLEKEYSYEEILKILTDYSEKAVHNVAERVELRRCSLTHEQSYKEWVTEIRSVAKRCSFHCPKEDCGCSKVDENIQDAVLLQKRTLSLDQVIDIAESIIPISAIIKAIEAVNHDSTINVIRFR
ncbi:hypothetical protein RF11_09527 [Thelohanellus kitauei]|uniref:Uncharacterized protein n=1 Tax=Thelohanellus kitauei TaxID=669202 RepID=A0A0C2MNE5_THEKT|nr:hypothetical protein RF11_09527 [Thelohanellus kitauei]